MTDIRIVINNKSAEGGTFLTPFWFGFHDENFNFFDVGSAAGQGLEAIAEDGNPSFAASELLAADPDAQGISVAGAAGPIVTGETTSATLSVDGASNPYVSLASMLLPSNDAFVGNADPVKLFNEQGRFLGEKTLSFSGADVYDAGTEVNTELNAAFINQTAPNTGVDENGIIRQHPGFNGSLANPVGEGDQIILGGTNGFGAFIDPAAADFTQPGAQIAEVHINTYVEHMGTVGDDTIRGGAADDIVSAGDGNDTISGGRGWDVLDGGSGNDTIDGGLGNDHLIGGNGNDHLSGGNDDDLLEGASGNDELYGGNGNDVLLGGADNDMLSGGNGNDRLYGGSEDDRLIGGNGDDVLNGGDGNDDLSGGNGRDILEGGNGDDKLTGGNGQDHFVFGAGFGNDVITDFRIAGASHDILEFDSSLFADTNDLFAHSIDTAEGVLTTTGGGDTLLIEDVTLAELQAHPEDFYFV